MCATQPRRCRLAAHIICRNFQWLTVFDMWALMSKQFYEQMLTNHIHTLISHNIQLTFTMNLVILNGFTYASNGIELHKQNYHLFTRNYNSMHLSITTTTTDNIGTALNSKRRDNNFWFDSYAYDIVAWIDRKSERICRIIMCSLVTYEIWNCIICWMCYGAFLSLIHQTKAFDITNYIGCLSLHIML